MVNDGALPSIRDELQRKAIETYEWIAHMHESQQMSEPEVLAAITATFNATAGLVPSKITEQAQEIMVKPVSAVERRVMVAPNGFVFVMTWEYGSCKCRAKRTDGPQATTEFESPADARKGFEDKIAALKLKGWVEVE